MSTPPAPRRTRRALIPAAVAALALTGLAATATAGGGGFALQSADATPAKTYFDADRRPKVRYSFAGDATDVRIDIVDRDDFSVVDSFTVADQEPGVEHVARWDGRPATGGVPEGGRYRFRIGPESGAGVSTREARFEFYGNRFPVPARHGYGDGFGAGRHHEGQDIFAGCGKAIIAARGGRVRYRDYDGGAGNYVVINARATRRDYMYAHMQERSPFREGARVRTGDTIGRIGSSGNATGCHLHFELWRGLWNGRPDVTRALRKWDTWS